MAELDEPSRKAVVYGNPRDEDILCGRGGQTNNHLGNEWYRRLIRANRSLYRACPKHTKLLVSKAIVQAVFQQGGRFLEKNDEGVWYEIGYKKAVDKTSQGLREKDRSKPNVDLQSWSNEDLQRALLEKQLNDRKELTITQHSQEAFNLCVFGSDDDVDLKELADIALTHAEKTDGLPRKASEVILPSHIERIETTMPSDPFKNKAQAKAGMSTIPIAPYYHVQGHMAPFTGQPIPTTLNNVQAAYPAQDPNNKPSKEAKKSPKVTTLAPIYPAQDTRQQTSTAMNGSPRKVTPGLALIYPRVEPTPGLYPTAQAPPLTRLTSQVSDWLTHFWPVQAKEEMYGQPVAPYIAVAERKPFAGAPSSLSSGTRRPEDVPAPVLTVPAPLKADPVKLNPVAPLKRKDLASDDIVTEMARRNGGPETVQESKKRKVDNDKPREPSPVAGRTELEHSVSATLLHLASAPSRLFNGLTTFFEGEKKEKPKKDDADDDLLGDYSESEEEARLRVVR